MTKTLRSPFLIFGLMVIIMFGLMIGLMIIVMALFSSSAAGLPGMWGMMIVPFLGMLMMPLIMFFVFRKMAGSGGSLSGMMTRMMGHSHNPPSQREEPEAPSLTYNIPSVTCGHCRMTIEREVGKLPGVASVSVDVNAKQAVIRLVSPPTEAEIEALLAEIGYPPEPV